MNLIKHPIFFILIALSYITLFSQPLSAARALPEFSASYGIQKFGVKVAEAKYQLTHTDTGYRFSQNTNLYGLASVFGDDSISAVSLVDEIGGNLLLKKHTYIQTGREKNRDEDFEILWNTYKNSLKGKISGIVRSKEIALQTDTEIWEVLSFQIPLMIEAREEVKEYPYKAILKGEIDTYHFILTASKPVTFAEKKFRSLQLVRKDPHKNRQLHIWLIPELHNIPVIVENYRDGKLDSRMQLESVQFDNDTPLVEQIADNDDDY